MSSRGTYVAVSGPIGVGKTVFARIIAEEMGAKFVPEAYEDNPFLERLYQTGGVERWGLACEVSFLSPRYDQAEEIECRLTAGESVVTDWVMEQNLIFSRITLSDEEFGAYRALFERLMGDAPEPDILVCLDAEPEVLLERVRKRGREAEYGLDLDYLADIRQEHLAWRENPPPSAELEFLNTTDLPIPTCEMARMEALNVVWNALGLCPVSERAGRP